MLDRRRNKRHNISYYLQIIDASLGKVIGHLSDISPEGLRMDSQQPIPIQKTYRIRIQTAADISDRENIEFIAISKWCRQNPIDPVLYDVGMEIISINTHDRQVIQRMMEKYSFHEHPFDFDLPINH
jgi:hypothetical protein